MQFIIHNLEWIKTILEVSQATNSPVILGATEMDINYMGSYNVVSSIVKSLMEDLNITIQVALHLDHGTSIESCKKAINAGFSSIMLDGTHLNITENIKALQQLISFINNKNIALEAEVGAIAGTEDDISSTTILANLDNSIKINQLNISLLAIGINNFHGFYPKDWKSLNFDLLQQIAQNCNKPLVLHGGSGIPKNQVLKAIKLGICQVNINSELQLIFAEKLRQEIVNNPYRIIDENTYQTILANCIHALKKKILSFFINYGSLGKSINMK